jgi:ABC-2 type transport system ATP-binding protein
MNKTAITVESLEHHYQGRWQLNVNQLSLEYGQIYGLIGRNGAGKSTLMRLIGGMETAQKGRVQVGTKRIAFINTMTSYPGFCKLRDIAELFALKAQSRSTEWDSKRFERVIDVFSLNQNDRFEQLSTGERSGFNLAVLLAQRPKIWLLDEPTLGIDIVAVNQCLSLLSEYFIDDEPCVIFATHQMHELERLADQVLIIRDGHLAWQGDVEALHGLESSFTTGIESMLTNARQGQPV